MENNNRNQQQLHKEQASPPMLKAKWIKTGLTEESVAYANHVGAILVKGGVTTSQIRALFSEMRRIQLNGFQREFTAFLMLKPKMAYATKRHEKVSGMKEFKKIIDECWDNVDKEDPIKGEIEYNNFMHLFEAILAYHKSNGGQ